ncbi:DOPA 4,5-dioxygenase family protein [Halocynthiibacter namhaensis]|uniref:DOPA 4,5-dioxygenase family protein n=1 Tax=Halocynthiibacter namhaensis TaxID=1290553 RepID=UPI0005795BC0|nr:DOPA 4,5-dioxygenase family protein [Halocynthiibacter namhaensis]
MTIIGYHAHIYYEAGSKARADAICHEAAAKFGVTMGRMHDRPVGPHPMPSCQLGATPEQFAELLPWLALNRQGLIVFSHPDTGQHLQDHRDRGIWLGVGLDLDLSIFQ